MATKGALTHSWQNELSIIVPVYNEEGGIRLVLEQLAADLPKCEIIVVDDASTDGTAEVISEFENVRYVHNPFNQGYGASLKKGMQYASGRYIAWIDGDNEHKVGDLAQMVDKLVTGKFAAIIGERSNPAPSFLRRFGKFLIRLLARTLGASSIKDVNCGLRVFHAEVILRYSPLLPNKFSASMTSTMILVERGYPVEFFPITVNKRLGESKVVIKDGIAALFSILRIIMLVAPLRIFVTGGLAAITFGGLYGLARMLDLGGGFPNSAFVVITFGMFSCVLGLIADQISQLRLSLVDRKVSNSKTEL